MLSLLWELARHLRRLFMEESNAGQRHYFLLWLLEPAAGPFPFRRGPQRIGDLAHALRVTPAAVTQAVAGLEADGLVRRVPAQEDRRAVRVELTEAGAAHLATMRRNQRDWVARQLARLGDENARTLVGLLTRFRDALAEASPTCGPRDPRPHTGMAVGEGDAPRGTGH
ncbi:MAG: winged helix-turn-helix transcriptional regulator [Clostridia bacterium]|nr:winged helix-turn-helix transcriptional regulator [Clostridia bacterium]